MVKPNEIIKIWTDIKAYMKDDERLEIVVRSSMGGKFMLANTIGIIDSDYYSNIHLDLVQDHFFLTHSTGSNGSCPCFFAPRTKEKTAAGPKSGGRKMPFP